MNALNQIEVGWLHALQDAVGCAFLDFVMPLITSLSNTGIFWIILAVILLFFKKTRRAGMTMGLALIFGLLLCNLTLKPLTARIRPYIFDPSIQLIVGPESEFSFPSGHTISAFEGAVGLWIHHRKAGWACIVLAALIGFSRLYLMVHYPTDVIAGMLLGIVLAFIASWCINRVIEKTKIPAL